MNATAQNTDRSDRSAGSVSSSSCRWSRSASTGSTGSTRAIPRCTSIADEGVNGIVGLLLCFIIVGYFKLPQYVGRMYRAEGNENPPVSGLTGLWGFVPYVGVFIYLAKVQGALNNYWKAKGAGTVAPVPACVDDVLAR